VRFDIGQALYAAQSGEVDPSAKPLKGFGGSSVLEIVARYDGDTWRAVYTVRFEDAVYVLHAFHRRKGRGCDAAKQRRNSLCLWAARLTPRPSCACSSNKIEIGYRYAKKGNQPHRETACRRAARPQRKAELNMKTKTARKTTSQKRVTESSGNVFRDLGLPNPEQELMKTRLTLQIYRIIRERGLTQAQAAKVLGIKQPNVSLLMRNRSGSFSAGRLMEFLTALGQDVEITVRPARKDHGEMSIIAR
jgi:predicted XRE-type DNA-binding protein